MIKAFTVVFVVVISLSTSPLARATEAPPDTIVLVACVATKRDHPAAAKDLYISPWFKMARAYAETKGSRWFILSDKHGLVGPDEVLAPYDESLTSMTAVQRRTWAKRVLSQIDARRLKGAHLIILAGKQYRQFLLAPLRTRFQSLEIPMEGMSRGRQLQWLKEVQRH